MPKDAKQKKGPYTFPETNGLPLKMDGWNTTFLLERSIFRRYVSFREGITFRILRNNSTHNVFD